MASAHLARILPQMSSTTVVELPEATYPSVAISGDDLNQFVIDTKRALSLLYAGDGEACAYMLDDVVGRLSILQADYERVMRNEGRLTPYVSGRVRL